MPWFRFSHTPQAELRAWIDAGRIGEPPTVELTAELPDLAAAQVAAGELRDQLVKESGSGWVWVTEVSAPDQDAKLPT